MREVGLIIKFKRKYVITTKSNNVAENVLNREFKADKAKVRVYGQDNAVRERE